MFLVAVLDEWFNTVTSVSVNVKLSRALQQTVKIYILPLNIQLHLAEYTVQGLEKNVVSTFQLFSVNVVEQKQYMEKVNYSRLEIRMSEMWTVFSCLFCFVLFLNYLKYTS